MSLITFEPIELPTPEDITYMKEVIEKSELTMEEYIAAVLPVFILELTNNTSLDLLHVLLEEYYKKNQEEFIEASMTLIDREGIEASMTLIDREGIVKCLLDEIFRKEITIENKTNDITVEESSDD